MLPAGLIKISCLPDVDACRIAMSPLELTRSARDEEFAGASGKAMRFRISPRSLVRRISASLGPPERKYSPVSLPTRSASFNRELTSNIPVGLTTLTGSLAKTGSCAKQIADTNNRQIAIADGQRS